MARLPSGKTATYTIDAEGLKVGDVRFRVELRSQNSAQPVIQEEATRVYDPTAPQRVPPPPPPAGVNMGVPPITVRLSAAK